MIVFNNERMVPGIFCKLLYDAVPEGLHVPVVFSYGKRHMPKGRGVMGCTNGGRVWLNLESVAFHGAHDLASVSAGTWRSMLTTAFHEFGHIALYEQGEDPMPKEKLTTEREWWKHYAAERRADAWAEERIEALLQWDDRLYQPAFLGVIDIVRNRHRKRFRTKDGPPNWRELKDYRCHVTGGQLSVSDVAHAVLGAAWCDKGQFRRAIRFVHRIGDDLARVYVDSAGRKHRFWVWGDLPTLRARAKERAAGLLTKRANAAPLDKESQNIVPF
jgi:hypothetical protein